MSSSETAESSQFSNEVSLQRSIKKLCLLNYSVKLCYCEYYCDLFIIVSVFYSLTLALASYHEEQHSDETRLSAQGHCRNMSM